MTNATEESTWEIFRRVRDELSPVDREEAYRKAQMATAYVWGWQDGRGYDADSQAATDFGLEYGIACADFLAGRSFFLRSIPDAFTRFAGGESIR